MYYVMKVGVLFMATNSRNNWDTLKSLAKYLWPKERPSLQTKVILALLCLFFAKTINVAVPYLLKLSIDSLEGKLEQINGMILYPSLLVLSYGVARILSSLFSELRDFVFVRVAQHAQRRIALETFTHLHNLSLEYHLSRQTGGISRIIDRGTKGIGFVLNFMTFNIIGTWQYLQY
jgi:ATP-binding cassette subfamily B protein